MIFLGLDPGYARLGYGVIRASGTRLQVLDYGVIETSPEDKDEMRLLDIEKQLLALTTKYSIQAAALEEVFFRKNLTTGIKLIQARGVILLTLARYNIDILQVTPTAVKKMITGYGKAGKQSVQQMTQKVLKLKTIPEPDDAADALALALSAYLQNRVKI